MTTDPTSNRSDSDLDMQAMLYALGDPSIDREAFESLLDSNLEAMEALSHAAWVIQGVNSSHSSYVAPEQLVAVTPSGGRGSAWSQSLWVGSAFAIAASLLVFFSSGKPALDSASSPEWPAIASAWSDVQASENQGLDPFAPRELSANTVDSEDFVLASANYFDEEELPDSDEIPSWLITAASRAQDAAEGTLQ